MACQPTTRRIAKRSGESCRRFGEPPALGDGAVRLDATYLYADMADSTGLAQKYNDWAAAKVIRCYLNAASRIIRAKGGQIRSFDGDRVMGIFIGSSKNSAEAKANPFDSVAD